MHADKREFGVCSVNELCMFTNKYTVRLRWIYSLSHYRSHLFFDWVYLGNNDLIRYCMRGIMVEYSLWREMMLQVVFGMNKCVFCSEWKNEWISRWVVWSELTKPDFFTPILLIQAFESWVGTIANFDSTRVAFLYVEVTEQKQIIIIFIVFRNSYHQVWTVSSRTRRQCRHLFFFSCPFIPSYVSFIWNDN